MVSNHNIIVLINSTHDEIVQILNFCRSGDLKLIVARTGGLFDQIFCDLCTKHVINDATGECPLTVMIQSLQRDKDYEKPDYVVSDCTKYDRHQQMHLFFVTIDERMVQELHV